MYEIKNLTKTQVSDIENKLEEYDNKFLPKPLDGFVQIGAFDNGKLIGGVDACMTSFRILYVSTVFVDEEYRRKGVGKLLMEQLEQRAKELGADMIRLDTFDWQGREFYKSIGFKEVGRYDTEEFSEHFYLKIIQ
ncbi:GNAT family N-acetyltransferase [Alkaliphilus peptidifermentans]|uniref:Acetyltransferase (GNAT) family protein n=1 Tax=Alkaliphilus peptidifermentans DSM 18978 TaxID=1120976 RepID=A0A1G5L6Q2_9FIRM|nr:GNAT family N-acetyltransferase [Alkaliphilus peptidifermentans]SCZ08552.1 Acetyltransferase (GNAT) family protein [Alkaliphilus peptidifermentans DSM 18978]